MAVRSLYDCYLNIENTNALLFIRRDSITEDKPLHPNLVRIPTSCEHLDEIAKMLYPDLAKDFTVWLAYSGPLDSNRYYINRSRGKLKRWGDGTWVNVDNQTKTNWTD